IESFGGGGVSNSGTFTMSGGNITGNIAGEKGGGVYNSGNFEMSDGNITGNRADTESGKGGGVFNCNFGSFTMSGGNITGNTTNGIGGGVYNSATFEMSGGSITENNVFENGGGVYNNGTFNVLSTAVVKNNTIMNTTANNLYLPNSKVITISDALHSGTSIGVTVENPPTEGNSVAITDGADSGNEQYFFSDDAAYETYYDSNKIKMKLKETCSHSGSKVTGQAATCTADGWKDYYQCSKCNKYFSDSSCTNSISNLNTWKAGDGKIAKLGHNWTYSADGATLTASCSRKVTCHVADMPLTITATTVAHSGSQYSGASISDTSAWTDANLVVPTIMYEGTAGTSYGSSATAPTDAGRYKATITVNGKTAAAPFSITGTEHTLKVESGENGTAGIQNMAVTGAAIASYTEVTLTATPNSGYRFKQWTVSGGAITITDNKFVMPDSDVTIKAEFEKISGGGSNPGNSSGGSTGGGSSFGENTSEVTTSKDSVSNTTSTTSPTEVKVESGTASATVKTENMTEAIKQAADNKSAEIVFTVSEAESGNADTIRLTISKSDAQKILDKTAADLVVTTPAGDVILSRDTLEEVLLAAEGTNLTIEVAKVTNPTEVQKQAAGDNGYIAGVSMVSKSKAITTFGGKVLTIRLEIPAALVGKDVVAIHIADDGKTEKMPGKTVTEGTKQYYEFTTTHLSTFALIEDEKQEETPTVSYPKKGTVFTGSKTLRMYKITKAGLTGGTVQFIGTKNTTATTITIPATVTFGGITYKVTSIAAGALKNNKVITKVVIGKNVTVIGTGAFSGCTKLKSVTIGSGVTTIYSRAFYNCSNLTTLSLPSGVSRINAYAFKGCNKLKTLKINSTKLSSKTVSSLAFKGISTKTVIRVPKSKLKTYKSLFVKKGLSKKVTIKSL
ncbi:MAG: leucine-rich repeat protein, partial [Lachnospiraceae bacterium]